jgi:YD repeat-containing protein
VTQYAYDGVGNQTSADRSSGQTTTFAYDPQPPVGDRPAGHSAFYEYDAVGNLVRQTDRNGRVRTFGYDLLDRMTAESWWDGGAVVRTTSLTYDAVGNLLTASDPDSSYTFTWDVLDRVLTADFLRTRAGTPDVPHVVLTYGYDAAGNITSVAG